MTTLKLSHVNYGDTILYHDDVNGMFEFIQDGQDSIMLTFDQIEQFYTYAASVHEGQNVTE